jgi:hypothetical protein
MKMKNEHDAFFLWVCKVKKSTEYRDNEESQLK